MRAIFFILLSISFLSCHAQKYKRWFPQSPLLPTPMKMQMRQLSIEFESIYTAKIDTNEAHKVRNYTLQYCTSIVDTSKNFDYIFPIQYWSAMDSNYVKIIPTLIARITDNTMIGLNNAYDILIWERMTDKQKDWLSYAYIVNDDLYQRAGRASYLLKKITGENFGDIRIKSTPEKLKEIQAKWQKWYNQLLKSLKG